MAWLAIAGMNCFFFFPGGFFFRLAVDFDRLWINGSQQPIDLFRSAGKMYLLKPPAKYICRSYCPVGLITEVGGGG